jgi:uncharacterized protein
MQTANGRLERSGGSIMMVGYYSAVTELEKTPPLPAEGDHSQIAKLQRESGGTYEHILTYISDVIMAAEVASVAPESVPAGPATLPEESQDKGVDARLSHNNRLTVPTLPLRPSSQPTEGNDSRFSGTLQAQRPERARAKSQSEVDSRRRKEADDKRDGEIAEDLRATGLELLQAARNQSLDGIRMLLKGEKEDLPLDYQDEHGFTALHHAVLGNTKDQTAVVEELLQAGCNVLVESIDFGTPLCLAALRRRGKTMAALLKYGAGKKIDCRSRLVGTALHASCYSGSREGPTLLLDQGATLHAKAMVRFDSLIERMSDGGKDFDLALLAKTGQSAQRDKQEKLPIVHEGTALYIAAQRNQIKVAGKLLSAGASANSVGNWKVLADLSEAQRKSPPSWQHEENVTALMAAASLGSQELVELLLRYDAKVNTASKRGNTALHLAAHNGHANCVEVLLKAGASSGLKDVHQLQPLSRAASHGHVEAVRILSRKSYTCGDEPGKALRQAVRYAHLECMEVLLDAGADPSEKGWEGLDALHLAVKEGSTEFMQRIIRWFVDRGQKYPFQQFRSVVDLAEKTHGMGMAGLLKDKQLELVGFRSTPASGRLGKPGRPGATSGRKSPG